jgi:hypothetical protein
MLPWSGSRIELVQSLALGFEVCLCVQVRRVKMRVTHPTAPRPGELKRLLYAMGDSEIRFNARSY